LNNTNPTKTRGKTQVHRKGKPAVHTVRPYFGHCIVCPSSIYGFWLPLWYLQNFQDDARFSLNRLETFSRIFEIFFMIIVKCYFWFIVKEYLSQNNWRNTIIFHSYWHTLVQDEKQWMILPRLWEICARTFPWSSVGQIFCNG
jgi:hypothetical protein